MTKKLKSLYVIEKQYFRRPRLSLGRPVRLLTFFLLVLELFHTAGAVAESPKTFTAQMSALPFLAGVDDFESADGGWTPSGPAGNWEHGALVPGVFQNCGFTARSFPEPSGAHSGTKVWGTKLNGCYENFNGSSTLSKTFDFRALPSNPELRWWQWFHVFVPYDQARVLVNDQEVWRVPDNIPTAGWVQQKVNLSAFSGQAAVTIQFVLEATSEVNRMGWYLDDIEIAPHSIYLPIILKQ